MDEINGHIDVYCTKSLVIDIIENATTSNDPLTLRFNAAGILIGLKVA